MGSYAYLRIGELVLTSTKNDVDPTVLMLFTEGDRRDRKLTIDEVARLYDCDDPAGFVDEEFGGVWPAEVAYMADLTVVKDRLEFMGFTLSAVREIFDEGVKERLAKLEERRPAWTSSEELLQALKYEASVLAAMSLETWLEAFAYIVANRLRPLRKHWRTDEPPAPELPSPVRFLLEESYGEGVWFPSYDFRAFMRAAVEITGTGAEVVYDVAELYEPEDLEDLDLCRWARREMAEEFVINHKVVVLAEGSSDTYSIAGALRVLYPHLVEYYSFMDFEGARAPGGAAALVGTIKAFVGAGIVNRIVALFDNDTAARAALRALRDVELPDSVRVLHYPPVPWAEQYPTLGPQGLVSMDVNGLAGSLELYFGLDVLRQSDGSLTPVQWRGYDEGMQQYQGEVMHKTQLQQRFRDKLRDCLEQPELLDQYDWTGMRVVLDQIRAAFQ